MKQRAIGRIVKSNSHTDYVCQVYAPHETAYDPQPNDYAFGRFVKAPIDATGEREAVGIVYDTILLNPEYGSLGPRLNPPSDQLVLSPDYLVEKATAVGIIIVGLIDGDAVAHGVIPLSLPVDAEVSVFAMTTYRVSIKWEGNYRSAISPTSFPTKAPWSLNSVSLYFASFTRSFPKTATGVY